MEIKKHELCKILKRSVNFIFCLGVPKLLLATVP